MNELDASRAEGLEKYAVEERVLGVNPLVVLGDVRNCVDDYLADGVDGLQKAVADRCDAPSAWTATQSQVVDQAFSRLLEALRHVFDVNFDKLDAYSLRNIFTVPRALYPHIDLEGVPSTALGEVPSEEREREIDARLERAHTQLQGLRKVRKEICAELRFYAQQLGPLEEEVAIVREAWTAVEGGEGEEAPMDAVRGAEDARPRAEEQVRALEQVTSQARDVARRRKRARPQVRSGSVGEDEGDKRVVSLALEGDFDQEAEGMQEVVGLLR